MRYRTGMIGLAFAVLLASCSDGEQEQSQDTYESLSPQSLVLAISWQPGFCERHHRKPECRSQTQSRYDAKNFSLHGLWPQPRSNAYCGVGEKNQSRSKRGKWFDLPPVQISSATRSRLESVMPGTQSGLDRHEWIKHGTYTGIPAGFVAAQANGGPMLLRCHQ